MFRSKEVSLSTLSRLQKWYAQQCDGDWEHDFGIEISTLDNPGWRVRINVAETALAGKSFEAMKRGLNEDSEDWHRLWVEGEFFEGAGDPSKLEFILQQFLDWAGVSGAD